jgi:hypothetical protein
MSGNLANLLKILVDVVQNHGSRIRLLEEGESVEDTDDADLTEELTFLLAKLQTPESGFATESVVPSDQM